MCSKRWAKPVRPGFSSFEPTRYQRLTATTGVLWSSWSSTVNPLGRENCLDLKHGDLRFPRFVGRRLGRTRRRSPHEPDHRGQAKNGPAALVVA